DGLQLTCRVTEVHGDRDRLQPKLRREIITVNVNVRWFARLMAVKVHPIRTAAQNRRHESSLTWTKLRCYEERKGYCCPACNHAVPSFPSGLAFSIVRPPGPRTAAPCP